jgi:hypothetical protein
VPSIVKLQSGEKIGTEEDPQVLADRFDAARHDGTLIKIDTEDSAVWVNPQVLATISPARQYRSAGF